MSILFFSDTHVFDEEEKLILNHLAVDVGKDICCEQLSMGISICDDTAVISVLEAVQSKILDLSVDEWADLQSYLPFDVSISEDDFSFDEMDDLFEN